MTESEIDNLGFNIYRSEGNSISHPPLSSFYKINSKLIAGAGNSSHRHNYSYTDCYINNELICWYRLESVDFSGYSAFYGPIMAIQNTRELPRLYSLHQNYPNPSNSMTTIFYELPKSSLVRLKIYDINGRLIETLVNENKNAGYYSVNWNLRDVSSGIYFYKIDAGEFTSVKKCLVVK